MDNVPKWFLAFAFCGVAGLVGIATFHLMTASNIGRHPSSIRIRCDLFCEDLGGVLAEIRGSADSYAECICAIDTDLE